MVSGQFQRRVSNERGLFIHYERWTIEGQGWDFKTKKNKYTYLLYDNDNLSLYFKFLVLTWL